jgi:F-type H+-transporting ATPase subunit b
MEVLTSLGINWKLFIAQAVNFSIILLVLWKWVFKPVAGALEARRVKIEESVKKAETIEKARIDLASERAEELKRARLEAEAVLNKAIAEAQNIKQETIAGAHKEAEKMLASAKATMVREKDQMMLELREEVATLVVMGTEKILREKINSEKDKNMIKDIVKSIK